VDSGFYAACAGLRARTHALEIVANNLSNINTVGYSWSQVDKRKVGKLATAIQVAFQELGVFPASSKIVASDSSEPIPFNTVQAIENAERTAALGRIAPSPKGTLGASENGDLTSLRQEFGGCVGGGDSAQRSCGDGRPGWSRRQPARDRVLRQRFGGNPGHIGLRLREDRMAAGRTAPPLAHRGAYRQYAHSQCAVQRQLGSVGGANHRIGTAPDHEIRVCPTTALGCRLR
jgi:Flagella basal body rod protein